MSTIITHPAYTQIFKVSPKKGITEQKKAELDALVIKVTDAQHEVEQFQAIADALTTKSDKFQAFLATADADRTQAYNNKVLVDQLVQSAFDLRGNSEIAFTEMTKADTRTKELAAGIKIVMDKLLYSAQVIDNITNKIIRKKSVNALISDDLISMLATAGKTANDAVALTLTALKSTFAAECSNMETEAALALEFKQSAGLYSTLITDQTVQDGKHQKTFYSLKSSLSNAYAAADANYKQMNKAYAMTVKQLAGATTALNKAQIKWSSLQQGLAAANAAALAS